LPLDFYRIISFRFPLTLLFFLPDDCDFLTLARPTLLSFFGDHTLFFFPFFDFSATLRDLIFRSDFPFSNPCLNSQLIVANSSELSRSVLSYDPILYFVTGPVIPSSLPGDF